MFTVYAVINKHMNNRKYFWFESIKHLLEGVHTIQAQRVSSPSRLSHVDETFSRGRWFKFCGKYNSDSYTSSTLGSRKNVISKEIWVGKQKNWDWILAEATDFSLQTFQTGSKTHPSCYSMGSEG
jgi:hypothetical protein